MRRTGLGLFACGLALVVAAQFVRPAAVHFGLPPEAVAATQEFVASLPSLEVVGADSDADNQRKRVVLDGLLLRANGGAWPWHGPQEAGDCAAQSFGLAVELDQAVQINAGEPISFEPVNRQWLYAGGRWQNGRQLIKGDGSIPSLIKQFIETEGVVFQSMPGAPKYSGASAKAWGNRPPPIDQFPAAKNHRVTDARAIRSARECCNAVNAGYPVAFGSMRWGTDSIQLVHGRNVARDTTDWPHAQVVTGYDGTLPNGQRLFRIVNSWGPNMHKPHSAMPGDRPGGYYVTWETMDAICREGMAFAVSGTQGFRQRQFDLDFSVIGAAGPPPPAEGDAMWTSGSELFYGLLACGASLMLAGAGVLFTRGKSVPLRGLAAGWLLMSLIGSADATEIAALDFSALATPSTAPPLMSLVSDPGSGLDWTAISQGTSDEPVGLSFAVLSRAIDDPRPEPSRVSLGYPQRADYWSHPGVGKADLIQHLQSGDHHRGKFDADYLWSLSIAELESLHSDDHEGCASMQLSRLIAGGERRTPAPPSPVVELAAVIPAKPQPAAPVTQRCPGGVCPTPQAATVNQAGAAGYWKRGLFGNWRWVQTAR